MLFYLYLAVAVIVLYPISRGVYKAMFEDIDEGDAGLKFVVGMVSICLAILWPAMVLGWLAYKISQRIWKGRLHEDT